MKKGSLVIRHQTLSDQEKENLYRLAPPDIWQNSGVVLRSTYEGRFYIVDASSGKTLMTELTQVVDLMIAGRVLKEVPIRCLLRVENVR
jgi:hypothetical protein